MIRRLTHGKVVWVNVVSPTREEIHTLMQEFALDPSIADELMAPSVRNRVDMRDSYFYTVLHFPAFTHLHALSGTSLEIDFVVGKHWIITTRYESIDPLHQFSSMFEVERILDKYNMGEHAGIVFYHMLADLYRTLSDELAYLDTRMDRIEEQVFQGHEREMVQKISLISRDLLNYTQALDTHLPMLESLETPSVALFGYEYARNVRSIIGEYERLALALKGHRATLAELRETNNSLLTTKQNEIMKIFTIMAFVTFPLTLLSSMFGMNTEKTPIIGHAYDFWIIVGIMFLLAGSFFIFFKHKKWL
jgi:magnesium transporter